MKQLNVKQVALIGVLGGVSGLFMLFRFPLPFMPPFMDFDFSSLPEMIGGFALGPIAAICIIIVKIIVKLSLVGSNSMLTGELQNIILSTAYVIPAVLFYQRHKSKNAAARGMLVGTIVAALCAVFTNLVIIIPFYVNLYGMSMDEIIRMCQVVNPYVSNPMMLAILGIIPFNLIKYGSVSILTIMLYKKISPIIKNFMGKR